MKTRLMKYFGIAVVLTTMISLTSCEVSIGSWYDDDDYSEMYYRTTRELCSRTWQETWYKMVNTTRNDWTFTKIEQAQTLYG